MKETTLKAVLAVAAGSLAAYLHEVAIPLIILLAVMLIDYISGMVKAWIKSELSSKVGLIGIIKKVCYLLVVCVAAVVDWLIASGLQKVGINITVNYLIGVIVTIWLIINELISILENLSVVGVPLPPFLSAVVHKLKVSVENNTKSEKEGEKA